jgi:hypothetical protein
MGRHNQKLTPFAWLELLLDLLVVRCEFSLSSSTVHFHCTSSSIEGPHGLNLMPRSEDGAQRGNGSGVAWCDFDAAPLCKDLLHTWLGHAKTKVSHMWILDTADFRYARTSILVADILWLLQAPAANVVFMLQVVSCDRTSFAYILARVVLLVGYLLWSMGFVAYTFFSCIYTFFSCVFFLKWCDF